MKSFSGVLLVKRRAYLANHFLSFPLSINSQNIVHSLELALSHHHP